jgi:hypothetical protein
MPNSTMSIKMPHATEKPVKAVRSLLWLNVWSISFIRSITANVLFEKRVGVVF